MVTTIDTVTTYVIMMETGRSNVSKQETVKLAG